jgi:hypothetical protein
MTGRTVWLAAALLALALVFRVSRVAASAAGGTRRVVVLAAPVALERALRTALMPWGMRVQRARASAPRDGVQAQTLARELGADALIWLALAPDEPRLWLYDSARGSLTSRAVPAQPLGETRSAALALSVKTRLLASRQGASGTPSDDGFSDGDGDPAPAALPPAPLPAATSPAPELDAQRADPAGASEPAPHVRLLLHAAVRYGATAPVSGVGRYGVEARWAPWARAGASRSVWLGARLDMGFDEKVERPWFSGAYSELGGGLAAGIGLRLDRRFEAGLQLGASLQSASLSGTIRADGLPARQTRLGASLHARPELGLSLGSFGIFVQPSLGVTLARQMFLVDAAETLETRPVWWQVGGGVRVDVD